MATLKGTEELIRKLNGLAKGMLPALGRPCAAEANRIIEAALPNVPRETGRLAESAFVDGPQVDGQAVSVSAGFSAEYAAFEHEGYHNGAQVPPPHFLSRAAAGMESRTVEAAKETIQAELSKLGR